MMLSRIFLKYSEFLLIIDILIIIKIIHKLYNVIRIENMNKQYTFRGMEHSNTIEEFANEQLKKIEDFLAHEKEPIFLHIILTAEFTHHNNRVEFQVTGPGYTLNAHREGPELYALIGEVMDCMYKQLTEAKRKRIDTRQTGIKRE